MRYTSRDYQLVDKKALQLRMDYKFLTESIDIFKLAKIIGMVLTPYSRLTEKQLMTIKNMLVLEDGFSIMKSENGVLKAFTFYNDNVSTYRQRFTIAHEIKHYIFEELDPDEKQEDLANHFARYILAPTCMVMKYKEKSPYEIASLFDVSFEVATNALKAANNRIDYKHDKLADYEELFLKDAEEK